MKANILYDRLENDFISSELSDIWAKYMVPVYDFLTENFKVRSIGLVCDFAEEITKVYSAVFPTDKILQQIIDSGTTDAMLFLHHPSIWDIRTTPTLEKRFFRFLSCSHSSKCLSKGMIFTLPLVMSVKSVTVGRWLVLMKILNCGLKSKLFSCRNLALIVSSLD
jgi:hypothetical protein